MGRLSHTVGHQPDLPRISAYLASWLVELPPQSLPLPGLASQHSRRGSRGNSISHPTSGYWPRALGRWAETWQHLYPWLIISCPPTRQCQPQWPDLKPFLLSLNPGLIHPCL